MKKYINITRKNEDGCVIWLTGLSGSGKTTLGKKVYRYMNSHTDKPVEFIDGDWTRKFFDDSLGYSRQERIANIKRIVFAAMLLARHGVVTVVSSIAPYYEARKFIRKNIFNYYQIYVKASINRCKKSNKKFLYEKAEEGKIKNVIGVDDVYDTPKNADIVVDTDRETVGESFKKIVDFLRRKKII